ncbi:hypothetical protein IW261DRAFT_1610691 [Armillaria novae-zelandiae]|uniref:Uncharacterized protein n=1 Tax=Armillaria novae-zelandiae TaxID=153914 RepID=A0AA39NY55_9AGAR|nr:hypothetical protein IW261DRAFT_1610691 [Armillaria novae-zelandiae]
MLDRDEAEKLPVVIPQEHIDNDPEAFAWYEGPQGGGFTVPFQFKKYPTRPVNETPMGYLHYIVHKCNWYTKDIHWAFFDAIGIYVEGLMEYAEDHYAEFIVPGFSRKHRGKRLQAVRCVRVSETVLSDFKRLQDIGELLSATQYEDDLDLVEEDDEYEINSFINDDDAEEEKGQEQESSETADDSEASSRTEVESTQPSDVEGSESGISGGIDSESSDTRKMLTTVVVQGQFQCPHHLLLASAEKDLVNSVGKASPRKRKFSSVDSSDHCCAVMVVPHFGDYIAFKLDPVACLKYLKDAEVTQSCEALKTTIYFAYVTHLFCFPLPDVEYISVSMTLVSQGLPDGHPDRFMLLDMAVPILPNNFNPLSRPPLNPTQPLPWPDCYHPTLTVTHCHIRNDLTVWDPDTLRKEQEATLAIDNAEDVDDPQPDEHHASTVTLSLPSEHDADSQYDGSVHKTIETSSAPSIVSKRPTKVSDFLHSLLGKISCCIPCLHPDLENYNRDLFDDPLQGFDLFGATPPDTMPVIEVIEDTESVKQINDPWNFFRELDALKRIEVDYHKRMKAKVQADIDRACEKDEGLYTHLQAKLRKRKHERLSVEMIAMPVTEDADLSTNI